MAENSNPQCEEDYGGYQGEERKNVQSYSPAAGDTIPGTPAVIPTKCPGPFPGRIIVHVHQRIWSPSGSGPWGYPVDRDGKRTADIFFDKVIYRLPVILFDY
jgi:hypothetical protein